MPYPFNGKGKGGTPDTCQLSFDGLKHLFVRITDETQCQVELLPGDPARPAEIPANNAVNRVFHLIGKIYSHEKPIHEILPYFQATLSSQMKMSPLLSSAVVAAKG
jgi:hypothetical protein